MSTVVSNCQVDWAAERSKWDNYFMELPLVQEDTGTSRFNAEFVDSVAALLPNGGRTLEAGCGAGWQSLALARHGGFQTCLLDFSHKALEYARRIFAREGLASELVQDDLANLSRPEFDLVFNAGVLEHYSFEDQVKLVRGMRSRSRRYVLILVPNRRCYWYWVWRQFRAAQDSWPWGKEVPMDGLARVFDAAGLQLLGERYFGAAWTESFITESLHDANRTRDELLAVHRSPIVPLAEKAYLVGALGCVAGENDLPTGWAVPGSLGTNAEAELTAALCDALAMKHHRDTRDTESAVLVGELRSDHERLATETQTLLHTLDAVSAQISEIQTEKRGLATRLRTLEQETEGYRVAQSTYQGRSEALTEVVKEREDRLQREHERFLDILARLGGHEATIKLLQAQLTEEREKRDDLETRIAAERSRSETSLNTARREFEQASDKLVQLQNQHEATIRALQAQLTEELAKRDDLETRIAAERSRSETSLNTVRREFEQANDKLVQLQNQHEATIRTLQAQLTEELAKRDDLETRIAAERFQSETSLNAARRKCEQVCERLVQVQHDHDELQNKSTAAASTGQLLEHQLAEFKTRAEAAECSAAENRMAAEKHYAELDAQRIANTRLQERLVAARADSRAAVTQFDAALTDLLNTLRSQRAWRMMLMIRKAYTRLVREGWRGKLRALLTPFESALRSRDRLERFDIQFPNIWDFVPPPIACEEIADWTAKITSLESPAHTDVIILPIFDFEFRFQRPQQIAAEFARSGHRVFWVSPSRVLNIDDPRAKAETVPLRTNVYEVRLAGQAKNIYTASLTAEEADKLTDSLLDVYRSNNIAEAIILVQFAFWRQVALKLRGRVGGAVVYDCMDDWRNWTAEPRISSFALSEEQQLGVEADLVVSTSAELCKRLEAESGRPVCRLRNGADFAYFRDSSTPGLLANLRHPIIGYYGAVADWVDIDLIVTAARSRPEYSFVIIGEVHNTDVTRLEKLENVHLLGEKSYRTIPSYLADFDVCILPFVLNDLTRAVDPVKVYEYLSQGKPVVATRLPEVCDHDDVLYLAGKEDFVLQLDRALTEDTPEKRLARMLYAENNSWAQRVSSLKAAYEAVFPLISILIVTYKSREYIDSLLDSIQKNTAYPCYELIIVDNASDDGSVEVLNKRAASSNRLRVIQLKENKGFAAGNNLAAREARGEFLVFLNADTIVTWGWLERLIRPFRKDPTAVGVTAPVTNFSGNETRVETRYRSLGEMQKFAGELADRNFGTVLELPMVPLFCAMVSRKVWTEVGELDEKFGLGMFEDDDLALRVRRLGYRIVVVEDCFIHHFGNGSFARLSSEKSLALFERNKAYFEKKWSRPWTPHRMRPGVLPPTEAERLSPARFCLPYAKAEPLPSCPRLLRVHPASATIGESVNPQPDGSSALVVVCERATPGTMIKFGESILPTAYGSANLLSCTLPTGFSRFAASVTVTLVNDFGTSNTVVFRIG